MHKDDCGRITIMCMSSDLECSTFWEKPDSTFSRCTLLSYWTQGKFISGIRALYKVLSAEVWTQAFLAEGFKWAQLLFHEEFYSGGCAEVSLWIRADDLLPSVSLRLNLANTPCFGSPCIQRPIAQQKSSTQWGVFVRMPARNKFFSKSVLCKIKYSLQIAGLHVQISTLGSL